MQQQLVVAAGRRGVSPRRPARAFGVARLGVALGTYVALATTAGAQTWRPEQAGRPVVTRESRGEVDSLALAGLADSLAAANAAANPAAAAGRTTPAISRFRSAADSVAHETTRASAERDPRLRVLVSLLDRQLWVVDAAGDTLRTATVAVGVDTAIRYGNRSWRFETPRGRRTVLRKEANPVWVPPEWHYVEVAVKRGLRTAHLRAGRPVALADGTTLVVRDGRAGIVGTDGAFVMLPADEEIVFDGKVFIPPLGSQNRRIPGELGRFKLALGDGYLLHGTPYENTIGSAATHGCVRMYDADIAWLYENVPAGTPVYIF